MNIKLPAIANEALGYVLAVALSTAVAWVAHRGWHVNLHLPALATGTTFTGALALARVALKGIVKSWHSGKLEAELLADAKRAALAALQQAAASSKGA